MGDLSKPRKMKLIGFLPALVAANCADSIDADKIVWAGAQVCKTKLKGTTTHKIMVNMNKLKATDEDADRGKKKSYTGFNLLTILNPARLWEINTKINFICSSLV